MSTDFILRTVVSSTNMNNNVLSGEPGSPPQNHRQHQAGDGRPGGKQFVIDRQPYQLHSTEDPTNKAQSFGSIFRDVSEMPRQIRGKEQLNTQGDTEPAEESPVTQTCALCGKMHISHCC